MSRPQLSIRLMLLAVAVVAGDLALMLRVPTQAAFVSFSGIVVVLTALALTGLCGRPALRAFCIGALVPLGMMLYFIANAGLHDIAFWLERLLRRRMISGGTGGLPYIQDSSYPKLFGVGVLSSIALGYLCVGFRWLIEPRSENPHEPPVSVQLEMVVCGHAAGCLLLQRRSGRAMAQREAR